MAASKSSFLQLFDNESKDDNYSFLVSNVQGKIALEDAYTDGTGRPMEFKSKGGYKFYEADGVTSYDLSGKLSTLESDVANAASNPVPGQNTQAIADLTVAMQAKDSQLEAAAASEVSRASTAEAANANAISAEEARALAAEAALQADISTESSSRAAAVSAEESRALAAEQSLQQQISSVLSNVDPALIDSISELLAHVNQADQNLINTIANMQSQLDDVSAKLDQLTSE